MIQLFPPSVNRGRKDGGNFAEDVPMRLGGSMKEKELTLEQCLELAYQYGVANGGAALHAVEPCIQNLTWVLKKLREIGEGASNERK